MARLFHVGFEMQTTLEYSFNNASSGVPVVSYPTPGRSGITGTRSRLLTPTGFGGGQSYVSKSFTPSDEIYGQFVIYVNGGAGSVLYGFQITDASANNILRVATSAGPTGIPDVLIGTATSGGSASAGLNSGTTWTLVEFYLKIDPSVGEINVKFDGVSVYSFSGNTDPNSRVDAANMIIYGGGFQTNFACDDWILNDTSGAKENSWVNNQTLFLATPNGNGDDSDLTGSDGNSTDNYLLVDEFPNDGETTYVAAGTAGLKDLYNMSDVPTLPAGSVIKVVEPVVIARRADPGTPSEVDVYLKSGTTEVSVDDQALTTSYAVYHGDMYYEDPDDSADWDETKVDAIQIGIQSS